MSDITLCAALTPHSLLFLWEWNSITVILFLVLKITARLHDWLDDIWARCYIIRSRKAQSSSTAWCSYSNGCHRDLYPRQNNVSEKANQSTFHCVVVALLSFGGLLRHPLTCLGLCEILPGNLVPKEINTILLSCKLWFISQGPESFQKNRNVGLTVC